MTSSWLTSNHQYFRKNNNNEVKGVKYDLGPPQEFVMSREFSKKLLLGLNSSILNNIFRYSYQQFNKSYKYSPPNGWG